MNSPIPTNPFTERGRIIRPERFIGRWRELSLIFERLETRRPILITGVAGIGKSSLLTHIAQAASATLELPTLESLYIDLAQLDSAAAMYRLISEALGSAGDNAAALELALIERGDPVLLALDGAETAIAAGWGELVLEALARIARRSTPSPSYMDTALDGSTDLMVVAACTGAAPLLSEPFAVITMGAVAATEVRLLTDAYLDETDVSFAPRELHELWQRSAGHPAYLQRAAFHLFRAKTEPGYDWRTAYRDEVRSLPVPGAPLPPGVFEGDPNPSRDGLSDDTVVVGDGPQLEGFAISGVWVTLLALLGLGVALFAWRVSGSVVLGVALLALGIVVAVAVARRTS